MRVYPDLASQRVKTYVLLIWIDYGSVYNGGKSKRRA
jgi:hypothetical protein